MDQIRTGKFIADARKEKGLTQRQLADQLMISDKTVSKWECGNGLPEVALMLPLCEILGVSVNELLSGERLSDTDYRKKAEDNMMDLMKEREQNKKKVWLQVAIAVFVLLPAFALMIIAGVADLQTWVRWTMLGIGLFLMLGGIGIAAAVDMHTGTFECKYCKTRFVPTAGAYIAGPHTILRRYLKCPNCGKKSYCRRRLTH